MRTVFYYCQTSSNIAAPDRATGTMLRVGAFRQWSDIGTVNNSLALRWSSALMTVTYVSNFFFSMWSYAAAIWRTFGFVSLATESRLYCLKM